MNTQTFNHTPHKCRKKLLSWLLVLCLCAGLLPVRVFAEQSIPCLEFALAIPTANSIPTADAAILTPEFYQRNHFLSRGIRIARTEMDPYV